MPYDLEHLGRQVDELSDAIKENTKEEKGESMNDIAGLLALMQGNKGMDLPGLLAVRNQGDRTYDATRNVGDTVRDCCCKLEAFLASLNCKVDGVSRDIRESSGLINAKIELEALKQENARAAMECRILQSQKDCCCEMSQRFDRLECTINTNRLADENARLQRENDALKDNLRGDRIADAAVSRVERFITNHYKVTNVPSGASA